MVEERTLGVKRKTHFEERKTLVTVNMKDRKEFKSKRGQKLESRIKRNVLFEVEITSDLEMN